MEVIKVLLLVFKFYEDVKTFLAFREKYTEEQWINEGKELTKAIKEAETDEQRKALVRRLSQHVLDTPR